MVGDGIHLQSLGEIVHDSQKVSIPTFALWEQPCNVDGDPLRWFTDIILVHQALAPGVGALAFCIGAALLAPPLIITPHV